MGAFPRVRLLRQRRADRHFVVYKEYARAAILARLEHWNTRYGFSYRRVAIRNQRRCWGSCSAKQNLNFNYKIIFLPEQLMDYVIVHELCHLAHLNHSAAFWNEVGRTIPDYASHRAHLRRITRVPAHGFPSSYVAANYPHDQ